jgi:membrane associated rhomboid family serine protease/Zn-finger nucleic acid-binding protein
MPRDVVNDLWQTARNGDHPRKRRCPACGKRMAEVPAGDEDAVELLDVCTVCQFVWFDASEYEALPAIERTPQLEEKLSPEAREKLALLEVDTIMERARGSDWGNDSPEEWWQWIPALLGMPVEHEAALLRRLPLVTWSLALLITIVSVFAFSDIEGVVDGLGLIPARTGRYGGLTLLTSFFLHGGLFHLIGNVYFLLVFGDNVEDWLGRWRYALLLACSALVGDALHVLANPESTVPCIGASGGISGVIAFYALRFPRARLGMLVRIHYWFRWVRMPAYAMFLVWVGVQAFGVWAQLAGFSNVSSLAHIGGACVGFVFWLVTRGE